MFLHGGAILVRGNFFGWFVIVGLSVILSHNHFAWFGFLTPTSTQYEVMNFSDELT